MGTADAPTANSTARKTAADNIEAVLKLEEANERRAGPIDRISQSIASFVASIYFIALQSIAVVLWIALPHSRSFDPFPYPLLSVVLSLETVFLTSFVLIRQNRFDIQADRRNHLDLQINLLTEKEVTKALKMLQAISAHLALPDQIADAEAKELTADTAVDDLADQLEHRQRARRTAAKQT
jgi:uncharacterized membrane protein